MIDFLNILNGRGKRLPGYSYKLGEAGSQLGLDVAFQDRPDVDEQTMSVRFPFASGIRRDGVGDLLEVAGIRTERHRINPLIMFDHGKTVTLPIGLAEDPTSQAYTVEIDPVGRTAFVKAFFYQGKGLTGIDRSRDKDHALFCEQLFDLIAQRFIRGGSIGYQTVKALPLAPDYTSLENPPQAGLHLLVTILLEASAVVMPANADTVLKMLALPKVCGKALSPYLVKSLAPYAPARKAQLGYERKAEEAPAAPAPVSSSPARGRGRPRSHGTGERTERGDAFHLPDPHAGFGSKEIDKYPYGRIEEEHDPTCDCGFCRLHKRPDMKTLVGRRSKWRRSVPVKSQPSDNISPDKARQILKDGEVQGHPLTDKQRRLFGAAAGKNEKSEGKGASPMKTNVKSSPAPSDGSNIPTDGGEHTQPEGEGAGTEGAKDLEPYGATVLRKIHEHHLILLEDYDEALQVLENDKVKKHLTKLLEGIEGTLTATEEIFGGEYKDLDGLDGAWSDEEEGEKEVADDASSAGGDEEEVSPDEVVEGMEEKRLLRAAHKILRAHYGKGFKNFLASETTEVSTTKPSGPSTYAPGKEPMQQHTESTVPGGAHGSKNVATGHIPGQEAASGSELKISPREAADWDGAKALLKELAENEADDQEKGFKAYHYWKLLNPMQSRFEDCFKNFLGTETTEVDVTKPSGESTYSPGNEPLQQHTEATVPGGAHGSKAYATKYAKSHDFYKTLADAGAFLKSIYEGKAGDDWRQKAAELYERAKNFLGTETTEVDVTKPSGESTYSPGQEPMQQHTEATVPGGAHGAKQLQEEVDKQSKEVESLTKKLETLLKLAS